MKEADEPSWRGRVHAESATPSLLQISNTRNIIITILSSQKIGKPNGQRTGPEARAECVGINPRGAWTPTTRRKTIHRFHVLCSPHSALLPAVTQTPQISLLSLVSNVHTKEALATEYARCCASFSLFHNGLHYSPRLRAVSTHAYQNQLAYGLLEPFVLHLRSAKDQIAKGGYSVTLRPPPAAGNASWFTKGTLQRFVRFVSTPEVLERVVTIEREIQQIGDSIQSYEASNAVDTDGLDDSSKSAASFKTKGESNGNPDASQQENSKVRLQRVLDTRKAVLRKEQAMAYARALAAGYEMFNLDDLLSFADAFGASRLRDACINFVDLCKKKNEDRLWIDEIAAMQALPQPDLSYFGSSGIVLAGEDNIQGGKPYDTSASDSSISRGSDINADQMPSTDGKGQIPFPWANQLHYMHNFPGYQAMPPYQGYVFPGMQVPPQYYPNNMQWPPNANMALGSDREPDDYQNRKSSSKKKNRRRLENVQQSEDSECSDSGTDSDSSVEHRNKKKHEKKSSRRVVIRNINYITSNKKGEKAGSSEESSTDEDYLDGDSIKQQVEEAVGTSEKHHKTHHRRRRNGSKHNGGIHSSSDNEDELFKMNKGKRGGDENWDAFQQLLLRDDSDSNEPRLIQVEEGYHTTKSSSQNFEADKTQKQISITSDAFLMSERDTSNEAILGKGSIQNFEACESIGSLARKGNTPEEFMMLQSTEEDYSRLTTFDGASHSSIIKRQGGDDWIISKMSAEAANNTSIDLGLIDGTYVPPNSRDFIDDSMMIQSRSMDNNFDIQLRFDIDMVSDTVGKASVAVEEQHGKSEATGNPEPEELFMVLDRDTSEDYPMVSWMPEMDFENHMALSEASKRQSDMDAGVDTVITSNGKDGNKKTRPALARDTKSRSLNGPPGRSKAEWAAKNTRPPWGSRAAANKSKLQKEEESRKRMEELVLQRQKRIAERSGSANVLSSKKTSTLNRTKSSSSTEKPKVPSPNDETQKVQKPVLRSSTIDRLAASKTVQKLSATSSKSSQPKKEALKVNGGNASSLSKTTTPADQKKPNPNKMKPSDGKSAPKNLNGVVDDSVSDADQVKEIPAESPCSELITAEDTHVPDTAADSEDIKEMHVASLVDKYEEKPTSETNMINETGSNQHPVVEDLPKPPTDNETFHCEVQDEQIVQICPPLPEMNADPVPELPTTQLNVTVDIEVNGGAKNITPPSYREISEIEESTPPSSELNADPVISRKKWITNEDPPKAAKGFRKLLMFGRRRIQYA